MLNHILYIYTLNLNNALISAAGGGHLQVVKYLASSISTIPEDFKWRELDDNYEIIKYFLSIGIPMDKFGTSFLTKCIHEDLPEDAEFIAQFYKKQVMKIGSQTVPKDYVPKEFHEYVFKYGIIYEGSNCAPMNEEYKKEKK